MSWVSRVKLKINIAVNWSHVESVESKAKINIGVNGVFVESVESKAIFFCLYIP